MAKQNSNKTLWILTLLVVATGLLYWFSSGNPNSKQQRVVPPSAKNQDKFILEKSGAGTTADFTVAAWKVHGLVDEALVASKVKLESQEEQKREVPRQAVEGVIRWHLRQALIIFPDEKAMGQFREALNRTLLGNADILTETADQYKGRSVVRLDIGLRDKLEGDSITLITDKLYLAYSKKSTEAKDQPPGKERGKLAIIIDDFGYTSEPIAAFTAIDRPLTFAVLPYHPHSQEAASRGLAAKHQVMLHLPMEPLSAAEHQEKTSITTTMSDYDIQQTVVKALANVPGVTGVNNHQGSKATADKRVMKNVLTVVKAQQLFFVDSRTSSQSIAGDMAQEMDIRSGENELFLDNSSEVDYIKQQLRAAGRMAIKNGTALVIGHARVNTAIALREMITELEANGVRLVLASQLVKN